MGRYYTEAADVLRAAGLVVVEYEGWQSRARSSGGFAHAPLGIQWHHTASSTSPINDASYQAEGSDDSPIGNMTIMRDGAVWLIAAGAANTAGKGGPLHGLSRGVVPLDSANSTTWAIEVANNGVGERWPQVQVDAYFAASNALNALFGNLPSDVFTHALGAGDGWTSRKVDPAVAESVEGPWQPARVNSSGTWSLAYIRGEAVNRAAAQPLPPDPGPEPEPMPEPDRGIPDVLHIVANNPDGTAAQGPCVIGPGYWHYARNADEAYVWVKMWGPPRVVDNTYDFDTLVRTLALEPDDGTVVGPGA